MNNDDDKKRTVRIKIKVFNQYEINDGNQNEEGIMKQEKYYFI